MKLGSLPERLVVHSDNSSAQHSHIRSFVLRTRRVTTAQSRALQTLSKCYTIPLQAQACEWSAIFGRRAPLILEIGFGMGEATAQIAKTMPEKNFIACEVHTPGVGALLARIAQGSIHNIRVVQHDAVQVLQHMVANASLCAAHIFFPDPWPKKRHHKRRLVQTSLLDLLAQKLQHQGYVHIATDWEDYALQIQTTLNTHPAFINTSNRANGFITRPDSRPYTKFENRGLHLGHKVWDLIYKKKP